MALSFTFGANHTERRVGVAGAVSSVNFAMGGRQKVIDQLARLGTNVLIVTPRQTRSVGGRARTGTLVTTLTPDDYASIRREVPLFARSSAFSTRTFLVKAGDLSKNNCVIAGVEPDYMTIKEWALARAACSARLSCGAWRGSRFWGRM